MGAVMALTMGSTAMQIYHQNKALEAQGRANAATARSMVSSMNRTFMNYEQQRRDIFEATVEEVEQTQPPSHLLRRCSRRRGTAGGWTYRKPPRSQQRGRQK